MIRPPGPRGVAFSDRFDGDLRSDVQARRAASDALGIEHDWATVHQVHGNEVAHVDGPGDAGEADALWTTRLGVPIAVFTADCLGVVVSAPGAVGVAHAGWRGASSGVVARLVSEMSKAGHVPDSAVIGPGIGPCCFEVGPEVAERFPGQTTENTSGSISVDLAAAVSTQLDGIEAWVSGACTRHEDRWFSHREDRTSERMAAIGWVR